MEEKNTPETLDEVIETNQNEGKLLRDWPLTTFIAGAMIPGLTLFLSKYIRKDRTFSQNLKFEAKKCALLAITGACAYVACNSLRY